MEELYDKYESLFNEMYDELLNKFYEESYLKNKMYKNCNGDICVIVGDGKDKPLRRLTFEDVKERVFQIWVNKEDNGEKSLESQEVMEEIINKVTLYYVAREVRKTLVNK